MIVLKVEEYCHNCPEFEPDVDKDKVEVESISFSLSDFDGQTRKLMCNTTIACEHRHRCAAIYECATNRRKD